MKILVVDDEQDVKTLFEQRFRKEIRSKVVDFVFAFSGKEALQYIDKLDHEAILILSDINMPGMSGLELLKEIKQKELVPKPIVMMISAYGDEQNYNTAKSLGADEFLTKPVDFKLLKEKLQLN
ncbi:response regulator [Algoriphagus pacificus]|uniref:Response regulator n=1 Tax=Algoriphagus pacificus TaxID=2811234 RepID=A0ABS3CFV9_9BACT|nr:response regulator [Algoriphagus pacificus]MBN7815991.1 response regulator [Algoriphagus pacificus]